MRKLVMSTLLAATAMLALPAQAATTIQATPTGALIGGFGINGASTTYGQTFTAPITGTLTNFTLWLSGGVGALFGGVGSWNGGNSYAEGNGSPTNLYQSADVASTAAGAYSFSPNVHVVAGQNYVAYLSVFGVAGANAYTTMPLATPGAGVNYFVWNNDDDPRGDASWNYFFDAGAAQFSATFAAGGVPEPATWAMLILGFGMVGGALRARRKAVAAFA